jgi:hypothetical protein
MRTTILSFLILVGTAARCAIGQDSPYAQAVLRDTPRVYLQFEDLDGSDKDAVRDSAGKHRGKVAGKLVASKGVPGIGGRAATFDGRTTVVTIADDGSFRLDALSVEFWLRSKQSFDDTFWPGSATLVSKATPGAGTSDWTINAASTIPGEDQGRLLAESGPAGKPSDLYLYSPAGRRLNDDRWHHIVWTRAAEGANRLFIDGELATSGDDGGGPISNDRSIQLGADTVHGGARHFAGQIDEVAVYDQPLSPERVRAHFAAVARHGKLPPAATRTVDFVKDIQPIFKRRCFECHGAGHDEGGLSLARRAAALEGGDGGVVIEPGSSVSSRLVHFVAGVDEDRRMPPEGKPLTNEEIGWIRAWIDQGAEWPATADVADPKTERAQRHWAFQPIRRPEVPDVRQTQWCSNPIDAFVLKPLEDAELQPGAPADRATLLRRASFDLIGLPPTPEEVEAFENESLRNSQSAFRNLVDRLLDSPHYGERWGRHWLDVVRYADSAGFELDSFYDHAARYRDYVIRSLNNDKPFDRFILEQIAADELWPDDENLRYATGMLTIGPFHYEGGIARPEVARYERLTDLADTTGTAFLGLTVGCARCHSHKYDPISQKDYFGLQAILAPGEPWDLDRKKRLDNSDDRKQPQNWIVKNSDAPPAIHVLRRGELSAPGPAALPVIFRTLPGGGSLDENDADAFRHRRTKLARWLISRDNPLTARVLANRVWQWHFGRPLVPTPDDFGLQGQPPTHPELLDYLASELIENEWKLKHLHRLIMSSSTYRAASRASNATLAKDPDNRLLSRFPRRRLEAEIIWDHLHAVSGTLNREPFGPSVVPPIEKSALESLLNTGWNVTEDERQWSRRGIYIVVRRSLHIPFFDTFNAAQPATSCVRRDTTVVSPQALTLLNGAVAGREARAFAGRLLRECGGDRAKIVQRAWLLAFGRTVESAELARSIEFFASREKALATAESKQLAQPIGHPENVLSEEFRAALVEFCLALMNTNEFIYID